MYKLYYTPTTASLSVHWALVHLELHHDIPHTLHLVDFAASQQKSSWYTALNPKGRVPTLVVEETGQVLTESPAILLYLAERHPSAGLAPPTGPPASSSASDDGAARAKYLETMIYLSNSLLPALRDLVYAGKDGPGGAAAEAVKDLARGKISDAWDLLDAQLEGKEYLVGDTPTAADFLGVSVTGWFDEFEEEACRRGNVKEWVGRMKGRDDWKEVRRREDEAKAKL